MNDETGHAVLTELREVRRELAEVKALLLEKPKGPAQSTHSNLLPLAEFCARLGRTHWWGYTQIRARKIIPAKTGKPYLIPIEQLVHFMPTARRSALST